MDYEKFKDEYEKYENYGAGGPVDWLSITDEVTFNLGDDRVNSPSHYTAGSQEVIDIIEEAIQHAPSTVEGMLQAQVLKYVLRLWLKDNPAEDAKKAQWYLKRLIAKMQSAR